MALGRLRGLRALIAYPVQLTELRNPNSGPTSRSLFDWTASKSAAEPRAPPRPAQRTCGTKQWWDEYSWLEDGESPKVQRLLGQERRHAEGWLRWCAALAGQLHGEMLPLVPRSQVTAPERVGGHEYWVQQLPGRPHPCYMRRALGPAPGPAEVVLDVNELAAVHGEYVQVAQMKLSRCSQLVAFTLEEGGGGEACAAFVRDLRCGTLRHLGALGPVVSLEWAADVRTLLATQPSELGRACRVVACDAAALESGGGWVLFEEPDERFFVELGRTKDWSLLTINCNSKLASEVHLLPSDLRDHARAAACLAAPSAPAAPPLAAPRLVQRRTPGLEYFVEHNGGQLYLLSNARGAQNYAVFRVPAAAPDLGQEGWQEVVPEREGVAIEDMDMARSHLVLFQRCQGRQQVAALPLRDGLPAAGAAAGDAEQRPRSSLGAAPQLQAAPLPGWALSVAAGANADFESRQLRLVLSSPVHPEAAFDWELGTQRLVPRPDLADPAAAAAAAPDIAAAPGAGGGPPAPEQRAPAPPAQAEQEPLTWQRLWATSHDGARVPLTVAHAAGLRADPASPRPCLLVVYGAYGHCLPTEYAAERIPLLRRGWVLALAHVRGGGELGRRWHAAGRGELKASSSADLEACLDLLLAAGYTRPGLVALEAHSAGGLAAGALLNRRAADLGAALLEAPFVDALSAMCRPELPLTVHEYEEWGDPRDARRFDQIRAVCPYQGVRPAPYPPTLLTCSQADLRVPFWGPLKHAARMRAAAAEHAAGGGGRGPILLLPDAQDGHFIHERDLLQTKAEQYAFLAAALEGRLAGAP